MELSEVSYTFQKYCEEQNPIIITLDQSWLSKKNQFNPQLLICPICYSIPIDYPQQCRNCERIFCKKDFLKVIEIDNKCPICKASPWIKKNQIHIAYKQMYQSLKFICKHCYVQNQMTKDQLIQHLESHNMYLSEQSVLYDYTFVSQNGVQLKLNLTQNLQINVSKMMRCPKFEISGSSGRVLLIDINNMIAEHSTLGTCKIIQTKSKMLKKRQQYMIWTVNIADQTEINEGKQRFVFYSEEFQNIIQKNYQDFIKNQRLNQFCLDGRQSRFRISFYDMRQTNTFTKSVKPILRIPIVLK